MLNAFPRPKRAFSRLIQRGNSINLARFCDDTEISTRGVSN
jgi:hypothetical protein